MSIGASRIDFSSSQPNPSAAEQERQRRIHELADRMATRFSEAVINYHETKPKTLLDRVNEIAASLIIGVFFTIALPFYLVYSLFAYSLGNTTIKPSGRD
jgi:hypothetical protein